MWHLTMPPLTTEAAIQKLSSHMKTTPPLGLRNSENKRNISSLDKNDFSHEIKQSTSSFKHIPLEKVLDANIPSVTPINILKVCTSTSVQEFKILRSNQSSSNSDFDNKSMNSDSKNINVIVNKTFNPNINSTIGNLETHSSLISNSSKKNNVTSTIATASQKV